MYSAAPLILPLKMGFPEPEEHFFEPASSGADGAPTPPIGQQTVASTLPSAPANLPGTGFETTIFSVRTALRAVLAEKIAFLNPVPGRFAGALGSVEAAGYRLMAGVGVRSGCGGDEALI